MVVVVRALVERQSLFPIRKEHSMASGGVGVVVRAGCGHESDVLVTRRHSQPQSCCKVAERKAEQLLTAGPRGLEQKWLRPKAIKFAARIN